MVYSDSHFYLYDLDTDILNALLLDEAELNKYIAFLIEKYYASVQPDTSEYKKLHNAYKSSFILEKLYRSYEYISDNYTAIYTKTGILRELTNDLYSIETNKVVIN